MTTVVNQSNPSYNLLILNAAWHNRGDEAQIRAMIDSFLLKIRVKKIQIMLNTSDVSYFPFPQAESLPRMPEYDRTRLLDAITLLTLGRLALTRRAKAYVRAVADADIVLDAPSGPLIGDIWGRELDEVFCLLRLYIPARRGKPVFFYAPSMGPFSGRIMNWLRRRVISKARGVIVREEISAKYLREQLGIASEVTADSSFQNQISTEYLKRYEHNRDLSDTLSLIDGGKVVGVSILDVRWMPQYRKKDELQNALESSVTALINWLIAEGYTILLLPEMFLFDPERELLDRFSNLNEEKIRVLDKNCDAYCMQVIVSKLFAVVSMRLHPIVFASKASVPALSISYEFKMQGFAELMGRSDLTLDLDEVDAQTLIERFTYLTNNYETIKQELARASQRLMTESQKTTERIIDELL